MSTLIDWYIALLPTLAVVVLFAFLLSAVGHLVILRAPPISSLNQLFADRRLLLIHTPLLVTGLFLFVPMAGLFLFVVFLLFRWVLDPQLLLLQLAAVGILWVSWRWSASRFKKIIAETIQPWLFGMSIVGIAYFSFTQWLPRADWHHIFAVETLLSRLELTLKATLPSSISANLALLAIVFALNVYRPTWKTWTGRLQKGLSITKAVAAVLAVVTSFTFFGVRQAGAVLELSAEEKYERLKDESIARSELILSARLSSEHEAETVKAFLDAVHHTVTLDMRAPLRLDDPMSHVYLENPEAWKRARLSDFVSDRVKELLEYAVENRLVRRASAQLDLGQFAPLFGRSLTPEEREQAKEQFTKALDLFAKKIASATFHPLSELPPGGGDQGPLSFRSFATVERHHEAGCRPYLPARRHRSRTDHA
jgi:hypothetical protein